MVNFEYQKLDQSSRVSLIFLSTCWEVAQVQMPKFCRFEILDLDHFHQTCHDRCGFVSDKIFHSLEPIAATELKLAVTGFKIECRRFEFNVSGHAELGGVDVK